MQTFSDTMEQGDVTVFEPSHQAAEALNVLKEKWLRPESAKNCLKGLSQDDLTWLSLEFLSDYDSINERNIPFSDDLFGVDEFAEARVCDLVNRLKLLLEAGLDPNHIVDEDNPIWECQYTAPVHDLNARFLRLLLEHGGNPCISVEARGEDLYSYINYKMGHEPYQLETLIPCFLMLSAFGGILYSGVCPVFMNEGHEIDELKEIEKLEWDFGPFLEATERQECYTLHIYNAETGEEIGHY